MKRNTLPPSPDKYWNRVASANACGCMLWTGCLDGQGYGVTGWGSAHRVAWLLLRGPIPRGICVLHKCDTPRCVNVDHLFLGTHQENMDDMRRKGRDCKINLMNSSRVGEKSIHVKLSEDDAIDILLRAVEGETLASLGREFGVTRAAISAIVNGKNWPHLPRPAGLPPVKPRTSGAR